jgi:pimeloyl-ACP methyl ester carboxylesterase
MSANSRWKVHAAIVACAVASTSTPASADDLVVVNSLRPGITVNTLVLTPASAAKATVILLPGGDGWLSIASGQPTRLTGNFLVRTRTALLGQGFRTVLVDAPSDRQNVTGVSGGFRTTIDHARDLAGVVKHFVPDKFIVIKILGFEFRFPNPDPFARIPAAVVGTSAGAVSAALAASLPGSSTPNPNVTGVGLTASVTSGNDSINNVPLASIKQPALFVHHVNDACASSPYIEATAAAYNMMIAGSDVTFNEIAGGATTDPNPCEAATYHGFSRAGAPALDFIKKWVLSLKR